MIFKTVNLILVLLTNLKNGCTFRIGIENVKVDWLTMRFILSYDKYSGKLHANHSGLGGGSTTTALFDKSVLSLGIFPINFQLIKKIDINIGFELAGLFSESFSGSVVGWMVGEPGWSYDLSEKFDRYSAKHISDFGEG
ncbi:MAG: hypothetical protein HC906_15785 [Bacteroidales bacterium]|nr:hypothetical protein [Bacteroidales bacterium]